MLHQVTSVGFRHRPDYRVDDLRLSAKRGTKIPNHLVEQISEEADW